MQRSQSYIGLSFACCCSTLPSPYAGRSCFRIYKIPQFKRSNYLTINRHYLPYLNLIEKINCIYCGYGNGLIEHARHTLDPLPACGIFFDYGDTDAWKHNLKDIRMDWEETTKS